ncbi:lactonase, 7-bladed beta-propeller domain-containing protein [Pochonia chlamydosporia 170]|uniref:Lactonase, 7-bladed beta-propeller domain-containing protein n=1 Tax=Pochonia chlamydosporia 170 TaxID=1380566 RepID=A0A179FEW0_METCM|nr:lactonase, 7-bladed beta-propeller domain-containing protein [Pochonia chlamydosporia 170]OAQ64052.1 lactonase, 7-bladed beta-propeller domain-containing protein [Pochonia chlamydosporia 170]
MKASLLLSLAISGISALPSNKPPQNEAGAVFAMTNVASDNKVIAFSRSSAGILTQVGEYSTGGRGQGVDFDTQGGLTLGPDHKFLYAVNPADDLVTVFSVKGSSLSKVQTVYAGDQPLSISVSRNGYAYVLDGSVASTGIFGFKINSRDGTLSPLTNKTIPLSSPIGVPGVVVFAPDGKSLVVTNKVGSTLDVFAVDENGLASASPMTTIASSGIRPFAATFHNEILYVIESGLPSLKNAALSTYRLNSGKTPSLTALTKAERNEQTDGCWVVVTPDGKWAYTANFVSGSISSYRLASNGTASLINGAAALPGGEGSEPVDLALSADGKYLYNLLRGTGAVAGFEIQADGSLKQVGELVGKGKGLPAMDGASGLAGY